MAISLWSRIARLGLMRFPDTFRRRAYGAFSVGTMALARLASSKPRNENIRITMLDRRFSGNLRAFVQRTRQIDAPIEYGYLSLDLDRDQSEWKRLPAAVKPLDGLSIRDMRWLLDSDIILSSIFARRLRSLMVSLAPRLKFVQVLHSIPLSPEPDWWFQHMGRFDRIFVSSPWMEREVFAARGIPADRLRATGFATLDEIARPTKSREELCRDFKLDPRRRIVLCAPTLVGAHESQLGSEVRALPVDSPEFLAAANRWAARHDVQFVIRTHPHELGTAGMQPGQHAALTHVFHRPASEYPNATAQMLIADAMISDLSGIAVYYLALNRPVIFWCPVLASESASDFLTADTLPGPAVRSEEELFNQLTEIVAQPDQYARRFERPMAVARERAFGETLDGDASLRYLREIQTMLGRPGTRESDPCDDDCHHAPDMHPLTTSAGRAA